MSQVPGFSASLEGRAGGAGGASSKPCHILTINFLGLSGMPKAGWFERRPGYELIVHVGGNAKRVRLRVPAPPQQIGEAPTEIDKVVPIEQLKSLQRLDERLTLRMAESVEFFRIDVWEERAGFFDWGSKGVARELLGQCYMPLEPKYSKRPCTWPIINHSTHGNTPKEVGFLTCKFSVSSMPAAVRNLMIVEGSVGSSEVQLSWDPPESDGGTALRGYRVEARDLTMDAANETPRTASAPASAEPTATLRNLHGNTVYSFSVWAVSEAGPGPGCDVFGRTGPVAPGVCGEPQFGVRSDATGQTDCIGFAPPMDTGGGAIVAYRVWLKRLVQGSLGTICPSEQWIDLGLFEHKGAPDEEQHVPLQRDMLPCLCSVAALSSAGLTGPSTREVPMVAGNSPVMDRANSSWGPMARHGLTGAKDTEQMKPVSFFTARPDAGVTRDAIEGPSIGKSYPLEAHLISNAHKTSQSATISPQPRVVGDDEIKGASFRTGTRIGSVQNSGYPLPVSASWALGHKGSLAADPPYFR